MPAKKDAEDAKLGEFVVSVTRTKVYVIKAEDTEEAEELGLEGGSDAGECIQSGINATARPRVTPIPQPAPGPLMPAMAPTAGQPTTIAASQSLRGDSI